MRKKLLVKRYSEAFASYAKDNIGIEKAAEELKGLKLLLNSEDDFQSFLYSPEIAYSKKCEIIDRALKGYFSDETRNFLKLILRKGRMDCIADICDYVRSAYAHGDAVDALLRTSYLVDTKALKHIKIKLEEKFHKKINLYLELDPDLLGGLQVRMGNTIIDGSVKRYLSDLREKLMRAQV